MIIPSIDIVKGSAVQLVGGVKLEINAGDPRPIASKFALAGEIAVVDIDAALGKPPNTETVLDLLNLADCRIGGGLRDIDTAIRWLDAGATKVVIGTMATPEFLSGLPRGRVIAALDARDGEVVVEGWTKRTGKKVLDQIEKLSPYVSGFLVTLVEREGKLQGYDHEFAIQIVKAAGDRRVTIAGGVTTPEDIAALDQIGADAQVGMALYTEQLSLSDAIVAPLTSDRPDGLWPTVVADEAGVALGLAYSSIESVRQAVESRAGIYHSRRKGIWTKGSTSGARQELLRIDVDCDRDALRFTVKQHPPGFCHEGTRTCWSDNPGLGQLDRTIEDRIRTAPEGSYTRRLLSDRSLLGAKVLEEAAELINATSATEAMDEAADLLYFALVKARTLGATLTDIERVLTKRARKVTRRDGGRKL